MPARNGSGRGRGTSRGRESAASEPGAVPAPWQERRVQGVDYETLFDGELHELVPGVDFTWPEVSKASGAQEPCALSVDWDRRYAVPGSGVYFAAPGWTELAHKLRVVAASLGGTWICEQNGGKYLWQYKAGPQE